MGRSAQPLSLDEQLSKEINKAVVDAMKTTFEVDVRPGNYEVGRGMVSLVGDVSGVIALVQDELEATMTICMTYETIQNILPRVIGPSVYITPEMTVDAVGEITNMIFGQIKTDLNNRGHALKLGIPSVVSGRGHFVSQFHRGPYMVVPYFLDDQLFQVHIAVYSLDSQEEEG